jgi:hypothetical protein
MKIESTSPELQKMLDDTDCQRAGSLCKARCQYTCCIGPGCHLHPMRSIGFSEARYE